MKRILVESLPFEIDARVPIQLGRESISSSVVAVSELVKNAYDADAEDVLVNFFNIISNNIKNEKDDVKSPSKDENDNDLSLPESSSLVIVDDGDGMNKELLIKYWLRIGTAFKTESIRSGRKKRVLTGAKGLGRLGIDRLCNTLILQTKQAGMDHCLEVHIDWTKYEKPDKSLSEIKHNIFQVPLGLEDDFGCAFPTVEAKGTRLIMKGLKDDWTESFLEELKQELRLLVSPFGGVNDFKINFKTGIKNLDGVLSSAKVLSSAEWVLKAALNNQNKVEITVSSERHGKSHIDGPYEWSEWIKDRQHIPRCGPFNFELYFIPRDSARGKTLNFKVHELKEFMEANQGVRIYRDFFRVRPYGEPTGKGDWLDLGMRRSKRPESITQKGWVVGPHQVVGAVFITREANPNLLDQTNREGIVEGPGYFDLRAALHKCINTFEKTIQNHASQRNEPKPTEIAKDIADRVVNLAREKTKKLRDELAAAAENTDSAGSFIQLKAVIDEVTSSVEEMAKATEEVGKSFAQEARELEADKDTLANLASLGILTVCFGHEAKEYANLAAANAVTLKKNFEQGHLYLMPPYDGQFLRSTEIILESTHFIRNFSGFALGNVRPEKRKLKAVELHTVVGTVFKAMSMSLDRQNIAFDLSCATKVSPIYAFPIDWESVLVNLLTNSIAAMQNTSAEARKIIVALREEGREVILVFADSGCGLEVGTENRIFDPMYTTKRDHKGNIEGTGMGLAIVKTFVEDHSKGKIFVQSPGRLGGAEFEIRVPMYREGKNV